MPRRETAGIRYVGRLEHKMKYIILAIAVVGFSHWGCSLPDININPNNNSALLAQRLLPEINGIAPDLDRANFTEPQYGIDMVYVQGGTFTMGCVPEKDSDCRDNEKPAHDVTLSDFFIGKYEVTQAQWKAITGRTLSQQREINEDSFILCNGEGDNYPICYLSWYDIVGTTGDHMVINGILYFENGFIYKLNQLTGKKFRLPTESEWEYAARGGNKSNGYMYSGSNTMSDVGWYNDNSNGTVHPVGSKAPNELGIHDMSGSVWEWCSDWYVLYSSEPKTNPKGGETPLSFGNYGTMRGGAYHTFSTTCRVARRNPTLIGISGSTGFRLVLHL